MASDLVGGYRQPKEGRAHTNLEAELDCCVYKQMGTRDHLRPQDLTAAQN